jgi:hypothetical protein
MAFINKVFLPILIASLSILTNCRSRPSDGGGDSADLAAIKPSLDFIGHVRALFAGTQMKPLTKDGEFVAVEFAKKEIAEHADAILKRNADHLALLVMWRMEELRATENLLVEPIPVRRKELQQKVDASRELRLNAMCFAMTAATQQPLAAAWPYAKSCSAAGLQMSEIVKSERENESRFLIWRDNYTSYRKEMGPGSLVVDNPENRDIIEAYHLLATPSP